ncbi:calcium-binding mitochondrial carrier protein SCaMC-2 [Schistocerca cancellata]|uniref:calcium-binding mitochondrial carrier protein SCaMC-2 n=1 Tax=Schistocerca cancellata TaxID=274614 RepID=UPI00211777FF|nr:calcium-binding mitochondrial carrier protein SCaMC-2 [Schistocerca cancellata]
MVNHSVADNPIMGHPPHYLHELPVEDEERLENLFKTLDTDGNGKIDIHDLSAALKEFGVHQKYAQKFLEHSDQNKSGDISLAEFIHYVREHEKNLRLQFSSLDKNKDGRIDVEELIKAFKELGVEIEAKEATKLLQRMDQDGSLNISFDEWRDFLLYAPSTDIFELIKYWRHATYLDIGEDMSVPDDFSQKEMNTGMWWRHLVAGGMAGAVSRTCTAPLDRLKVYLQVHGSKQTSMRSCLNHLFKEGGFWSFWRGNGINVVKIAPESAIKFMAYEQCKRLIRGNNTRELSIYERFVAGSLAGGISQTAIYPLEVLKTRLALRKTGQYKGIADAAKKIYKKEGLRSFYRGYVPNLLGIIPYAGIDLAVYETLKNTYLRKHNDGSTPSVLLLLTCGTISSTCGQVCSYPLALVRTRLQAQVITTGDGSAHAHNGTMSRVIRTIIQDEGFLGLYRGITPNFLKVAPAVSISYVVYERVRQALGVNMT